MKSDRRRFLHGALIVLCAPPLFTGVEGCGSDSTEPKRVDHVGPWAIPRGTVLDPRHYALLSALMDALIPGDADSPGAIEAHAPWYLDQLLGAFSADPPRIFAGGPYSGRHGGVDGFSDFQQLTRVEEIRWRTYIEGSAGRPEREFNGPVKGLVELYPEGLEAADVLARERTEKSLIELDLEERRKLLPFVETAFLKMVYEHAVEGTYGDPVYGGNFDQLGWKAIDYEGDRQPVGFTQHQMLHPEES